MEPSAQIKMCAQTIMQFVFYEGTLLNVRLSSTDPITWTIVISANFM
jgi:hypothetical protein